MINPLKLKSDFPIFNRQINGHPLIYLDNAATTQKPRQVTDALVDYYQNHNANPARSVHTLSIEATDMYENARKKVAHFIHARPEEIIFVRNATEALNLVAFSYGLSNLKKGDTIITSVLEHHSNLLPWRMTAEKTGAQIKYLDINEEGVIEIGHCEDPEWSRGRHGNLQRDSHEPRRGGAFGMTFDNNVKIVAISIKSNMTGALQPVDQIVKLVRKNSPQSIIILDGSHSAPHLPTDVKKLGADFLAFSGHKMLGPMGIGVLWGKKELLEKMPPFLRGGDMISEVTLSGQSWNTIPHKFEAGTPNVADAVGLAAAIDYLQNIGMENIHQYEIELTKYCLSQISSLQSQVSLELIGPTNPSARSGVVTFNIKNIHAHDVAQILDSEGVAVRSGQHCTGPLMERLGIPASVRASFYFYNTKEDVDRLIEALKKVPKVFKL